MNVKRPKVYFYCREEEENLQEDIITIAEGLSELGIPYYANCNYWLQSTSPGDYLFRNEPDVSVDDCDAVVVSYNWPFLIRAGTFELITRPLPKGLFKKGRGYTTVYMDSHDGHRTVSWEPEFRQFDIILRSKLNRRAWHPQNIHSWVLGLNNRILQATANDRTLMERRKSILLNFGASHPFRHGVRDLARKHFVSEIDRFLEIDETMDDLSGYRQTRMTL